MFLGCFHSFTFWYISVTDLIQTTETVSLLHFFLFPRWLVKHTCPVLANYFRDSSTMQHTFLLATLKIFKYQSNIETVTSPSGNIFIGHWRSEDYSATNDVIYRSKVSWQSRLKTRSSMLETIENRESRIETLVELFEDRERILEETIISSKQNRS